MGPQINKAGDSPRVAQMTERYAHIRKNGRATRPPAFGREQCRQPLVSLFLKDRLKTDRNVAELTQDRRADTAPQRVRIRASGERGVEHFAAAQSMESSDC